MYIELKIDNHGHFLFGVAFIVVFLFERPGELLWGPLRCKPLGFLALGGAPTALVTVGVFDLLIGPAMFWLDGFLLLVPRLL